MRSSRKTVDPSAKPLDVKVQPDVVAPRTKTEIADPDEFEAMKREFLSDPAARAVYLETLARFSVARLVTDMRTRAGLTQKELATLAGVSRARIAKVERASGRGVASIGLLCCLAAAAEVELVLGYATPDERAPGDATPTGESRTSDTTAGLAELHVLAGSCKTMRRKFRVVLP